MTVDTYTERPDQLECQGNIAFYLRQQNTRANRPSLSISLSLVPEQTYSLTSCLNKYFYSIGDSSDTMDTNMLIDLVHEVQDQLWVDKVNETHRKGLLCEWVSTFHPDKLPCGLVGTFHYGAFNAGVKMVFSDDNTTWMVRFPRAGMVCDDYANEKVAMEVSALGLIRDRTTIPVPTVQAWGPATSNPLGLGPFIIMDFINGVNLSDLLQDPNAERPSRVMREDISDCDIEFIYRQLANFLLQIFKLDFDQIGSLPLPQAGPQAEVYNPTLPRPLTFKAHCILQNGGVNTFGMFSPH